MNRSIPTYIETERCDVEQMIRSTFHGVTRAGGVSWTESVIVDGDGSGRTEEQARAEDTELCWEDLVDDPSWIHDSGMGGFNFVDPIGFRYYLAPAMIRCIRDWRSSEWLGYVLRISGDFCREQVSLLTPRQAHTVARFVRLMIALHVAVGDTMYGEDWCDGYKLYWKQWDRGNLGP